MQINGSVSSRYTEVWKQDRTVQRGTRFAEMAGLDIGIDAGADGNAAQAATMRYADSRDLYMAQAEQATNVGLGDTREAEGAVTVAESEEKGEILGITMVPEEGQAITYGVKAVLSEKSTAANPIVQVVSNLGGKKVIYNVELNKVNPSCATQLEMFALLSYTDKMGITDGGSFGSFHQLKLYAQNAAYRGYCSDLSGEDAFLNEKVDWTEILNKIMGDYLEAEAYNQYEDCKRLLDYLTTVVGERESEQEESLAAYKEKLLQKIQNGDTDTAYRIGAQEYTEKQWKEFLERFDSVEEMMRELMRERHKKEQEKREERERLLEEEKLLTAQTTVCTYPTTDPTDADIRYITWYTEEGIFCRKAGQTEGYEWSIAFENKEQYKKVTEFIAQFPEDGNLRFAAHENFWMDFLNNAIPLDEFVKFIKGTDKGVFVTP